MWTGFFKHICEFESEQNKERCAETALSVSISIFRAEHVIESLEGLEWTVMNGLWSVYSVFTFMFLGGHTVETKIIEY